MKKEGVQVSQKGKGAIKKKSFFEKYSKAILMALALLLVGSLILNITLGFQIKKLNTTIKALNTQIEALKKNQKGDTSMQDTKKYVLMETSYGNIKLELYSDLAPKTVQNFLDKVNAGAYNGTIFHRVIKDFMIQGGDPKGDGTGGSLLSFEGSSLKHTKGVISMAATEGGVNQSDMQFFIMHGDAPTLDGKYTAFGKVVEGIDIVDKIATAEVTESPTGEKSKPVKAVVIIKITEVKN